MKQLLPIDRIESLVQLEPALVLLLLSTTSFLIYKLFLGAVSPERHKNLVGLFKNLLGHIIGATIFVSFFIQSDQSLSEFAMVMRIRPYLGLVGLIWGAVVFIKTARILLFEYLFIGHMREGVPLLLINIFTLFLSLAVFGWITVIVFSVNVTPILTTFGVASVVLGLALQDTLGNLFAGISLQFDKPYEIGDWIEVSTGTQKWVGQVQEISWRATLLIAFTEELITVPNRIMAQSQIANFSSSDKPIIRRQSYRIPYGSPIDKVRTLLLDAAMRTRGVRTTPEPLVMLSEAADSWMEFRVVIFIDDYGMQYTIFDNLNDNVIRTLNDNGISFAPPRIEVLKAPVPPTAPPEGSPPPKNFR